MESRLDPRIQAWVNAIALGTPEAKKPDNRKRAGQQKDSNPRLTKRTTKQALHSTSGNIMSLRIPQQPGSPSKNTRSSLKRGAMPAQTPTRSETKPSDRAPVEDTPSPSDAIHIVNHPSGFIRTPPLLRPTGTALDRTSRHNEAQPLSSTASESSTDGNKALRKVPSDVTTTDSGRTKRSRSPSKMADLFMAERTTVAKKLDGTSAQEAGGFLRSYSALRAIGQGDSELVEKSLHRDDWPSKRCYAKNTNPSYNATFLDKVNAIHVQASQCEVGGTQEGQWNNIVHGPLLKLVAENDEYHGAVVHFNANSAQIAPEDLLMKNNNGEIMEGNKIDYVVGLLQDENLEEKIKETLTRHPRISQSLNQTMSPSLRNLILFLTLETKPPSSGGQKADVQLSSWGYSGFTKLHQMLDKNGHGKEKLPPMPMLSVHGHDWRLSGLRESGVKNVLLGKLLLGTTETIQGIFQIIRALEFLYTWGNTEYRGWYISKALTRV